MKAKILVVDDVDTIARVYARFLERQGYEVRIAFDGEEALFGEYEKFRPDLVISDIRMPKMSGFELANEIRKKNANQKIILMTGYADEAEVLERQKKSHGFPFFTKPADLQNTVSKIVKEVLEGTYQPEENEKPKRKKIEQQSKNLKNGLSNKEEHRYKSICGAIAHNMKNEFALIGSSLRLLFEFANASPEIREECEKIGRSITYCQINMQRLLDFFDISIPQVEEVNVLDLIKEIESLTKPRLPSNIRLYIEFEPRIRKSTIISHTEYLIGVLIELILNATNVLYKKGGVIELELKEEDGWISISVRDNGPGIPEKIKSKVFKDQLQSRKGLGLGLFYTKKVIDLLEGKISFQTSRKGTTFTVMFPLVNIDTKGT